jgi:hypothetical protein
MKKTTATVLHVFEGNRPYGQAYVAIPTSEGKDLGLSPSLEYEGLRLESKTLIESLKAPKGTTVYNCGVIKTLTDVGDTVNVITSEYEGRIIASVKGYQEFVKDYNSKMESKSINATANIIKKIEDSENMSANQLIATVMVVKTGRKERWNTYQSQRTGRSITSQSAFQAGLKAIDSE